MTQKDQEKLGRSIYMISDTAIERKKLYKIAFLEGLFSGFGGVIGATILVGIVLFILSFLNKVPLLGRVTEAVKNSIESTR